MSDYEKGFKAGLLAAADHIACCCPVGYDSPEAQQRAQSLVDQLAVTVLIANRDGDDGLGAVLMRMEERHMSLALELSKRKEEKRMKKFRKLMREADELLRRSREETKP